MEIIKEGHCSGFNSEVKNKTTQLLLFSPCKRIIFEYLRKVLQEEVLGQRKANVEKFAFVFNRIKSLVSRNHLPIKKAQMVNAILCCSVTDYEKESKH